MSAANKPQSQSTVFESFSKFVWNSSDQSFCGRTGFSWLLICGFYFCLYAFLSIFFVICLIVFFENLDNTTPKWFGTSSLTLGNPGLGLRPLPRHDSTLIRFEQGKPSSYKPYTDHLEAFLLSYEDDVLQAGRDLTECTFFSKSFTKSDTKACRIDLDNVLAGTGCTKNNDFGYEDGQPCLLLKMNKIFAFVPEPYETLDELKTDMGMKTDEDLRFLAFSPNVSVGVSCEGQNAADRENLADGGIEFHPPQGIPTISFPYLNQEGYRSPFVMVKFKDFSRRVVIQIECKLYAKNIDNSGTARRHGIMRFELLKD